MTKPVLLHIGMPKAASTFLQNIVFRSHPQVFEIERRIDGKPTDPPDLASLLLDCPEDKLRSSLQIVRSTLQERIVRADGRLPVWSNETFATGRGHVTRSVIVRRLGECFETAKVLLVIRNPTSAIVATYCQACRGRSMPKFNVWLEQQLANEEGILKWFAFDRVIEEFEDVFGGGTVEVLPFEAIGQMPDWFVSKMSQILEVTAESLRPLFLERSVNRAPSRLELHLRMIGRHIPVPVKVRSRVLDCVRPLLNRVFHALPRVQVYLSDEHRLLLEESFRSVHQRIAREYHLPLSSLGYSL